MRQKRKSRLSPGLPVLAALLILALALLLAAMLSIVSAIGGVFEADKPTPSPAAVLYSPEPSPEATPEPEEAVSRYAAVELTEEDAYILACLAYHEARGEPFEGQVAVIEVVFNRCLSDEFPDTVEEVVFQKYGDVWQFSPAPYLYTAEPSEVQYNAVMYAYNAEEPIVPPETVFFSTEPYNEYITAIIGNHYFCEIGG